ncbi:MAG: hypothetical protein MJA27_00705 [Pseudanabaenales cyanobacterium]|nr:hypothetical protein [Pseudanabaenales cyanobacterium]
MSLDSRIGSGETPINLGLFLIAFGLDIFNSTIWSASSLSVHRAQILGSGVEVMRISQSQWVMLTAILACVAYISEGRV